MDEEKIVRDHWAVADGQGRLDRLRETGSGLYGHHFMMPPRGEHTIVTPWQEPWCLTLHNLIRICGGPVPRVSSWEFTRVLSGCSICHF